MMAQEVHDKDSKQCKSRHQKIMKTHKTIP